MSKARRKQKRSVFEGNYYGPTADPKARLIHIVDESVPGFKSGCGIKGPAPNPREPFTHPIHLPSLKRKKARLCKPCLKTWEKAEAYLRKCPICGIDLAPKGDLEAVLDARDDYFGHFAEGHALRLLSERKQKLMFGVTTKGRHTTKALQNRLKKAKQELRRYFPGRQFVVLKYHRRATEFGRLLGIISSAVDVYTHPSSGRTITRAGQGFYQYLIVPR